ncbi:hypothetical protein HY496_03665 [Candidatus Woesearchaeota archaeon]|nr:hypothetical protein [Candidatus Woesearchaeota archaeon]
MFSLWLSLRTCISYQLFSEVFRTIERKTKHDQYLDDLCHRLGNQYDFLLRNVPLYSSRSKRQVAEIDILAVSGQVCDIYEVKCSYRLAKARKQLGRIKKILSRDSLVRDSYFYWGGARTLIKM